MGGTNSKAEPQGVVPVAQQAAAQNSQAVKDALLKGDQVFLEKDVRQSVQKVSEIFKTFNEDDAPGIIKQLDEFNESMKKAGKEEFSVSDEIKNSFKAFHETILSGIENYATMSDDEKKKKFKETMSQDNKDGVFKILGDKYAKDLEEKKNTILTIQGLTENKAMKEGVESIMDNVKALKVKYKFFEYKYIELNIFLILFVQHVYQSMNGFVTNVAAFNKVRDSNREALFKEAMKLMSEMLKDAGVESKTESLLDMMTKIKTHMQKTDEEMNNKMEGIMKLTADNLSGFIDALTQTTKDDLFTQLQNGKQAPTQGGMNKHTNSNRKKLKQTGGFVRDHSRFPQAFYDIEKIDLPPSPGTSSS